MDRRVAASALVVGLVVVAGATACRGDLGPPLSEWRSQADDICQQTQDEADKTRPVLFEQSLAQTLRKSADYSRSQAQQLRGLDKPSEERDKARDYLAALDDRNRELDSVADQAEHPGPDFKPPSLDALEADTKKTTDLAQQLGLKSCRSGIDVSIGGSTTTTASTEPDPNAPPTTPAPDPNALDNETQDQAG